MKKEKFKIIEEGLSENTLSAMEMSSLSGGAGCPSATYICGGAVCGGDACGAYVCGGHACGGDACGGNVCGLQLCPIDACSVDACVVDFFLKDPDSICNAKL